MHHRDKKECFTEWSHRSVNRIAYSTTEYTWNQMKQGKEFTTMKSSSAPKTKTLMEESFNGGTGSDAFSFRRSNNGNLELSVISF